MIFKEAFELMKQGAKVKLPGWNGCKGWKNARGCKIEHDAAVAYGLEIIYED